MSVKDCGHHRHEERRKLIRRILVWSAAFLSILSVVVLLTWAVLHPQKPRFILQDVTLYNFSASAAPPYALTAVVQATLASRNPNDRVGIYYRRLDAFLAYRGQQITAATLLPEGYQGFRDVAVWSPVLYGAAVPVAPRLQVALGQDLGAGSVLVDVKVAGGVRWKVGSWVSGKYRLDVNCPAYLRFSSVPVGPAMRIQLVQRCHVETALG